MPKSRVRKPAIKKAAAKKTYHAVHDSTTKLRAAVIEPLEKHRFDIIESVQERLVTEVKDFDNSPTNYFRQVGNEMATAAFEAKLKPILPDFVKALEDPRTPMLRHMYLIFPEGKLEHLLAYPAPKIPEHTVCYTKYEDVPDLSYNHINKEDIPPIIVRPDGQWDFDTSSKPLAGMKRVKLMDRIALKGWRQVLMQLIMYGVVNLAQVEGIFGSSNRKEWQHKLGKGYAPTPW